MADIQIAGASFKSHDGLQSAMTVQVNASTFYQFYLGDEKTIVYRKSTDGAATWGSEVTVATDSLEVIVKCVIWYDRWTDGIGGNLIHMFYLARDNGGGATSTRAYRSLDVSTDTLATEVSVAAGGVFGTGINWAKNCISIVKTRAGNLYLGGWQDVGASDNYVLKSTDDGLTWTSVGTIASMADGTAVDNIIFLPANLADKDDFWCMYIDIGVPELTVKTYDSSADSWSESSAPTIGTFVRDAEYFPMAAAIRWSDGHALIAIWSEINSTTADYKFFDFDGTTLTAKANMTSNLNNAGGACISINQVNDDIRCGMIQGSAWESTVHIFSFKSTDGAATWAGAQVYSEGAQDDRRWLSCDPSPPNDGGFLLVWRNDDLSDILTNIVNQVQPLEGASNGLSGSAGKHQIQVLADWGGDGSFLASNEDITADVRSLRVEHVRDYITDYMEARRLSLVLNNEDHKYSPSRGTISGLASGVLVWVRTWYPFDSFADVDATDLDAHTPDFDANWTWVHAVDARAFQIDNSDGAAKTDGGGAGNYFADFEFDDKDISISANISAHSTGGNPGLLFRFVDTSNYLFVRCIVGSSNNIEVRKVISGSETSEALGSFTWNADETHFVQVVLHGTSIRVFIDTSEVIDATFTNSAVDDGTRHGLFCKEPSTPARWFDFGGFKSQFFGRITSIVPIPDAQDQRCLIEAVDEFEQFQRDKLQFANTLQTSAQRSDQIMGELLTAVGFSAGRRQLESATTLLNDVDEGLKAVSDDLLTALQRLQDEEDGLILMDGLGYATLEKRDHREAAPHTVSKGTVSDVNTVTRVGFSHLEWDDGNEGVGNLMVARTKRATKASVAVVWTHPEAATSPVSTLSFAATETQDFVAETDKESADNWVTPVASTDYVANAQSDGGGSDITGELTVTLVDTDAYAGKHQKIRVLFGATAGFLTTFQLRADGRTKDDDPSDAHVEDSSSITSFGERRLEIDCVYIDRDPVARAMITNRLARRKDSKTQLRVVMPISTKIGMHQVIQRRISDRITAVYADMGINEAFFLEGWEWETSEGGTVVVVTWQLRGV